MLGIRTFARTIGELVLPRDSVRFRDEPEDRIGGWGWTAPLALVAGVSVFAAALADHASRSGSDWAFIVFCLSIVLLILPISARIIWPSITRRERIALVILATEALFVIKLIHEPIGFVDHDAFLHWATSNDILASGRLFTPNPLLPISAVYPGLEIVTTALSNISGLSVFAASRLVLLAVRTVFICALFLAYESISGSSRVAAIAAIIYMGCSSFVYFDAMFSYASLALTFLVLILYAEHRFREEAGRPVVCVLLLPIIAALAITHHLTAFITVLILAGVAALELARSAWSPGVLRAAAVAALMATFTAGWSSLVGNPSGDYLGPVIANAISEAAQLLSFSGGRLPFVSEDGVVTPAWQRYITMLSVLFVCLGLATSFFRSLAFAGVPLGVGRGPNRRGSLLQWNDSRLVLLTLITLAYPLSILLRMTRAGWEVGLRITPFAYLGIAIVLAIGIASYWWGRSGSPQRAAWLGAGSAIAVLAGIISGGGPFALGSPTYRVSADSASVEPMGVSAAAWTQAWLGPGHRFFADRTNAATYGGQQVATTLYDRIDLGPMVLAEKIGPQELQAIRETDLDFILLDLRLTLQLPVVGWYFDPGPTYHEPPSPSVFFKFNALEGVDRPFDNGFISIVDVRSLRDGR